jgi:hypothetical protein
MVRSLQYGQRTCLHSPSRRVSPVLVANPAVFTVAAPFRQRVGKQWTPTASAERHTGCYGFAMAILLISWLCVSVVLCLAILGVAARPMPKLGAAAAPASGAVFRPELLATGDAACPTSAEVVSAQVCAGAALR